MSKSCPIMNRKVDANLIRINAALVVALTVAFIYTGSIFFALIIAIDFFMRVFLKEKCSYLLRISAFLKKIFIKKEVIVDAGPKKVANIFGFVFAYTMLFFAVLGFAKTALSIATVLLICALLEAVFNYCVGCQVYYIYQTVKGEIKL